MNDELTDREIQQLIKLAKRALWSSPETRKKIQARNVNITPANFYSDIPLIEDIEKSFEYRKPDSEVYNSGIFDPQRIRLFTESIAAYADEFSPPEESDPDKPDSFYWSNPAFSYSDAMAYYCVIRHTKPKRLLEIGSGYSTMVANAALAKNGSGNITLIEPYPKDFLRRLEHVDEILETFVQDIPVPDLVGRIEGCDIWFIDSTHTVKIGSDCLYIYLKIMPEISKDILVHSHDIFLPLGMNKNNALRRHIYWTEQYLLYAYLLDNPKTDVMFGSTYVLRFLPESMEKLMAGKWRGGGGSLWYRLNGSVSV